MWKVNQLQWSSKFLPSLQPLQFHDHLRCSDPGLLLNATFSLDASTATSPNVVDSVGGMVFTPTPVSTDADGRGYWDLDNSFLERTGGGTLREGQFYTHAYVLKWRLSSGSFRTLLVHSDPSMAACAIVGSNSVNLGTTHLSDWAFYDSGYDINPQRAWWDLVVVTGRGDSATGITGTTTFYTLDDSGGSLVLRGTTNRVCSGNFFRWIGTPNPLSPPGLISHVVAWPRVLTATEIQTLPSVLGLSNDALPAEIRAAYMITAVRVYRARCAC